MQKAKGTLTPKMVKVHFIGDKMVKRANKYIFIFKEDE
jgi:hypothetical protein